MSNQNLLYYPNTTQIHNIIFDYWMSRLSDVQFKVLLAISRKTMGWQKRRDKISNSQLCELTGFTQNPVRKACNALVKMKLIKRFSNRTKRGDPDCNSFELNIQGIANPLAQVPSTGVGGYHPQEGGGTPAEEGGVPSLGGGTKPTSSKPNKTNDDDAGEGHEEGAQGAPVSRPEPPVPKGPPPGSPTQSQKAAPTGPVNLRGEPIDIDESEIYSRMLAFDFPTWVVQEAIRRLKSSIGPYTCVIRYVETTCRGIMLANSAPKITKKSKKQESSTSTREDNQSHQNAFSGSINGVPVPIVPSTKSMWEILHGKPYEGDTNAKSHTL